MAERSKDLYEGAFADSNGVDENAHIVKPCNNCGNMPQGNKFCTTCGTPRGALGPRSDYFKGRKN